MRYALLALLALASMGFEWEGRLGRLARQLEAGDARQRQEVVRLMATYPADEVRGPLLTALEDSDLAVRQEAARTAGIVRLGDAAPILLGWLEDPDADVRAAAAVALGAIGDTRPIPSLVRALGDASADVRRAAIVALASMQDPSVVVPLLGRLDDDDPDVRVGAANALADLGDARAVVPLVGRGRDESPEVRTAVYTALGALGDRRAVAALIQSLRDDSEDAKLAAISALGRLGVPRAVPPLVEMLSERDARVAQAAIAALGAVRGDAASGTLIESLNRADVRQTTSAVLARRTDPQMTLRLAEALDGAQGSTVLALANILSQRLARAQEPAAAAPILAAYRSTESHVLLVPLASTGEPSVLVPILEQLAHPSAATRDAALSGAERYFELHPPDGRAADPLLEVLGDVPAGSRARVVRLLGIVRASRALDAIRELTENDDEELRLAAVEAIGAIGDRAGADVLLSLLDADDGRVRFGAAIGLGASADGDTLDLLLTRMSAPPPVDRHAVMAAIAGALETRPPDGERATRTAATLRQAMLGSDLSLASRATSAAGGWQSPLALELLIDSPRALLPAATMALGTREDGVETIRERLNHSDAQVRVAAAARLGEHGTAADATRLADLLAEGHWPMPSAAAFSLARMARRGVLSSEIAPRLCAATSLRDVALRANVVVALAAIGARCDDGETGPVLDPIDWTGRTHSPHVRAAAYRWLHAATADADRVETDSMLARCAAREIHTSVREACAAPELPALGERVQIYAYDADGESLMRSRLVTVSFADGSMLVAPADANAYLRLDAAPRGVIGLGDPLSTPLDP